MGARMKDIARDLGVSLMTVSKALRSHSDISEETKRRVLKRAKELKYRPNWIARSLVTRRTYMVGLIIPDLMHSFFAEVAGGVTRKLQPLGYQVVIAQEPSARDAVAAVRNALAPWKPRNLILPDQSYPTGAMMPSAALPQARGLCWNALLLDNASIHCSHAVAQGLRRRLGCARRASGRSRAATARSNSSSSSATGAFFRTRSTACRIAVSGAATRCASVVTGCCGTVSAGGALA